MMRMKKIILIILVLILTACSGEVSDYSHDGEDENVPAWADNTDTIAIPVLAENHLTGLTDLVPGKEKSRPIAVVVSNIKQSLPQRGIGSADIVYEAVTEGGITRLLAVFADVDRIGQQLGPVRSVRECFVDIAMPHNPILVHHGGSDSGYALLRSRKTQNIDGMNMANISFVRDDAIAASKGLEHSSFTNSQGLKRGIEQKKYIMESDPVKPMVFADGSTTVTLGQDPANTVRVPFSNYVTAVFEYDPQKQAYLKSQFGSPHIDGITGEQITVTNLFVLFARTTVQSEILTSYDLSGNSGFYINGGEARPITYTKSKFDQHFKFIAADGNELIAARGKSWICIVPVGQRSAVSIG
ncbi:MAG: DUF3048 domain-containing protein [Oscillospiraceae bacterium]|nr:DUF3048 domain-containing protein [Oscillospiraceae bacterium]